MISMMMMPILPCSRTSWSNRACISRIRRKARRVSGGSALLRPQKSAFQTVFAVPSTGPLANRAAHLFISARIDLLQETTLEADEAQNVGVSLPVDP